MTNKQAFELVSFLMDLSTPADTFLDHAKSRTLKNATDFILKYNDKIGDIRLDNCSTNEKGHILRDANTELIFTKDATRKMQQEIKYFWDKPCLQPFEVLKTDDTKGLNNSQIEFLSEHGFISKSKEE